MRGSLRLGTIAGIGIEIHFSWFIIFGLVAMSLALDWFPGTVPGLAVSSYWIAGATASLLLFGSVLVHELAHSLVAKARGMPVKSITLFVFGGVSSIEREPNRPGIEFQMAFVGPLSSAILGAIAWVIALAIGSSSRLLAAVFNYLAIVNILLAVFNLLPGLPLDGGRVLRAIVWKVSGSLHTATAWASRTGQFLAYLFIAFGLLQFFSANPVNGLWLAFIGWFLLQAAEAERLQSERSVLFAGVSVAQVMNPPAAAPANISLQALVDEYILGAGLRLIFVTQQDQLAGIITLGDVRQVPREYWGNTPVGQVMTPLERLTVASPALPLNDALALMATSGFAQLPVVDDGRLVGVLSQDAIARFAQIRRSLGVATPERDVEPPLPKAS